MQRSYLSGKPLAWIFSLIYFASYTSRINFAAIIQEIVTSTGFSKTALSVVLVSLSVTYGIGMVINGKIGDHVKPQNLILCGLLSTTLINLLFPFFSASVTAMAILWGFNGFAQAMMWPPIVKILVANTNNEAYGYAVVRVSWGSSFGTIFVYLTAPLIISLLGWKEVFGLSALIGIGTTVLWILLMGRIYSEPAAPVGRSAPKNASPAHFPRAAIFPLCFIVLGIVLQGMLRDGVTSWMPTYLAEVFQLGNQTSILCTVSLAVFSILSFSLVGEIHRRFFRNEVACAATVYVLAFASALALFLFFDAGAIPAIAMMTLLTGCMHAVNLMLVTHVPKRFKKYGNISTISGAINASTYAGSAIFSYGVSALSESIGWRNTVGVWAVIALLGIAVCLVAMRPWKAFALDS